MARTTIDPHPASEGGTGSSRGQPTLRAGRPAGRAQNVQAVQRALKGAGVQFIPEIGGGGSGVKSRYNDYAPRRGGPRRADTVETL
jgi:hypothetical protein